MVWLLIIAGGTVALAFFLLMDLATLAARERSGSIRRAAGYGKTRTVSSSRVLDDGTFKDRALDAHEDGPGASRPAHHAQGERRDRYEQAHAGGPQPQGVADELPGLEGDPRLRRLRRRPGLRQPCRRARVQGPAPGHRVRNRRLHAARRRPDPEDADAQGSPARRAARRARSPGRLGGGGPRVRRRDLQADGAHGRPAGRRVRARARRDAHRRESSERADEDDEARRHA